MGDHPLARRYAQWCVTAQLAAAALLSPLVACGGEYLSTVGKVPHSPALGAEPRLHTRAWAPRGEPVTLRSRLWRSDGGEPSGLQTDVDQTWLSAQLGSSSTTSEHTLTIQVDTGALGAGEHAGAVTVSSVADELLPAVIRVRLRLWELTDLHLGPASGTCPHYDAEGASSSTCHFQGPDALAEALAARPAGDVRLLLHDDDGELAEYRGCVDVPGRTWIESAPGVDARLVAVACADPDEERPSGVLRLVGPSCRVARLSLVNLEGSGVAVSTWIEPDEALSATGGHLLEDLYIAALNPEIIWANGIETPLALGPDTTVRNCRIYGYYDGQLDLRRAARARLLHNTFVFFQNPLGPMDVRGAVDLVFANNVVLSLAAPTPALLRASAETTGLVASGNAVEGYQTLVDGLAETASGHTVEGNWVGELALLSPYRPVFLADATNTTGHWVLGEGSSLEGEEVDGRRDLLPGAYQQRSDQSGPRAQVVRVGDTRSGAPGCGDDDCDIPASWPNEIQIAAWTAWPGAVIEIYDANQPYAGDAVIGWGVTLRGMSPEDAEPTVVLQSEEEDEMAAAWGLWRRHRSLLVVQEDAVTAPVVIENLVLRVDRGAQASETAVLIEGTGANVPALPHVIQRVRIEATGSGPAPAQALWLGDRVRVQDVLVHGPFGACARYGPQHGATAPFPEAPQTTGWVINTTCRLTGSDDEAPRAAFEIDWVAGTLFANLVLQLGPPDAVPAVTAPLFWAERQAPGAMEARSISVQGRGAFCAPFACSGAPGLVLEDIVDVTTAEPLFASDTDSHLDPNEPSGAIDGGIEFWVDDPSLPLGRALDGILRTGRTIDRGAYEQGG